MGRTIDNTRTGNPGKRPVSSQYRAAGGDSMPPDAAGRHFGARENKIAADIRALPLAEKLRLAADFVNAGATTLGRRIAALALSEFPPEAA